MVSVEKAEDFAALMAAVENLPDGHGQVREVEPFRGCVVTMEDGTRFRLTRRGAGEAWSCEPCGLR